MLQLVEVFAGTCGTKNDLESHDLTLSEAISMALEVVGCECCYALIVVQARNDDDVQKK